jgi:chromosome segregation ATPase
MRVGAMLMLESQENSSPLQAMQKELQNSGTVLTKAWTDLFGIIMKYQLELSVKENTLEIAGREVEMRKKQFEEMKPLLQADNEELSKLQHEIQSKKRDLYQSQQELSLKQQTLQMVQSNLNSKTRFLEKSTNDLADKQNELLQCKSDVESLKSELTIKEEQMDIKDSLLQKVQGQLLKENTELREQMEMDRKTFEQEIQSLVQMQYLSGKAVKKRKSRAGGGKTVGASVSVLIHSLILLIYFWSNLVEIKS